MSGSVPSGSTLERLHPCARMVGQPEIGDLARYRYSGAVPGSTDDRLRTSSFQRVPDYTSISLINRIRGSNCRMWRLSDTVREPSSTAVLNAHQCNPCRPSIIWKVVWTISSGRSVNEIPVAAPHPLRVFALRH